MAAVTNLVNAEAVTKAYGTTTVLEPTTLGVAAGERIGLVGANGAGKSTLMRLLTAQVAPDTGRVTLGSAVRVAYLDQTADPEPLTGGDTGAATVSDAVLAGFDADHQWAGDARIRAVLAGLGLPGLGLDTPLRQLSGGELRRVALAAVLIDETELLALDEPTNHLDVEVVGWLAEHLRQRRGGLLVVTHDRWFLDAVCEQTWEVAAGQVHRYDGGYAAYVLARAERDRQRAATAERRRNLLRKELAWLRRGAPARTSKPKFRLEAAAQLIEDVPPPRDSVQLRSFAAHRLGKTVYELAEVSCRLGERMLLDRATWQLGPGDRVGLVGVNGAGKSTLLRLLAGELAPDAGRVVTGATVRLGYLPQRVTAQPPAEPGQRLLEAVSEVGQVARLGAVELSAAQLAERFGFPRRMQWTPVADLSGGQRRRLELMRLLMAEPNVLLLDEPTNDLDVETLTELEDLLDGWAGSLLVVSHDRYFLERVCETVVALLGDGRLSALPGGVAEYLERRRAAEAGTAGAGATGRAGAAASGRGGAAPATAAAANGAPPAARQRADRKELSRLGRRIEQLERRQEQLHQQLAEAATDYLRLGELEPQLRQVVEELSACEDQWLELSERLES